MQCLFGSLIWALWETVRVRFGLLAWESQIGSPARASASLLTPVQQGEQSEAASETKQPQSVCVVRYTVFIWPLRPLTANFDLLRYYELVSCSGRLEPIIVIWVVENVITCLSFLCYFKVTQKLLLEIFAKVSVDKIASYCTKVVSDGAVSISQSK